MKQSLPTTVRPTVEAARRVVRSVAPEAQEIDYDMAQPASSRMMWKIFRYAVGGKNVVGIGTFPGHSTLYFYRGRELDDGSGLLQGGGKEMRFVTLNTSADAEKPAVKRLVRKAFKLAL